MESGDEEYYYYSDEDDYSMGEDGAKGAEVKEDGAEPGTPTERRASSASVGSSAEAAAASRSNAEYAILTPEMLEAEQDKLVTNVSEVLDIDYDTSNVLLLHFRWNKERLFDAYYADAETTCKNAGAVWAPSPESETSATGGEAANDSDTFLCEILFVDVPIKDTFAMACGHRYSLDAWQNYLREKVGDGKDCIFTLCPSESCTATVSPKNWEHVLLAKAEGAQDSQVEENRDTLAKYKRFLGTSFVEINRTMRYCPGRNCNAAVKSSGAVASVKCSACNTLFCFKCGQEAHAPTSCAWLALWQEKCSNESETANWILANTKKCPKCSTRIEKNQGCNHMQCKVCKADFCWVCMGSWSDHGTTTGGYYNCNRYEVKEATGDPNDKVAMAKLELDRYLHYYKRYAAQAEAGKFASTQRERAETKMVDLQQASSDMGWVDVQFLTQAVEQVIDCRRVLKNTYIHAYYLPAGPKKSLFEYLQSLLESHTEKLSGLTEEDINSLTHKRSEVINYTRVTGKFLHSLLEQVDSEGIGIDEDAASAAAATRANDGDTAMEESDAVASLATSASAASKRSKTGLRRSTKK